MKKNGLEKEDACDRTKWRGVVKTMTIRNPADSVDETGSKTMGATFRSSPSGDLSCHFDPSPLGRGLHHHVEVAGRWCFTGSVGRRILIVVPVDTLYRTSIISSSIVLLLNPFANLSLAPLFLFSIYGPDLGVWPDCWVSTEFLRAPIPRKGSGSTTTTKPDPICDDDDEVIHCSQTQESSHLV